MYQVRQAWFAVPSGFITLAGHGGPFYQQRRFAMNKDFWKCLFCWLETASVDEIRHKQCVVRQMLGQTRDPDFKADIRRILRFMDEEILARAELANLMRMSVSMPR